MRSVKVGNEFGESGVRADVRRSIYVAAYVIAANSVVALVVILILHKPPFNPILHDHTA